MYALSIIVPCLNESGNINGLIPRLDSALQQLGVTYEIIVVDNGSLDKTKQIATVIAAQYSTVSVVEEKQRGFGLTLRKGFSASKGEVLGYIHGDNQMNPRVIVEMYKKLQSDNVAVCKAMRRNRRDGGIRSFISISYNFIFRILFGTRCHDINGSPKIFTRDFYEAADLKSEDWFIDPEIVIKADHLGFSIAEHAIDSADRLHGVSKVHFHAVPEFLINIIRHSKYWRIRWH
jgi:glycosyltransferase involved in cell wall biosynthesis